MEAQLPDEVNEFAALALQGQLFHCCQIIMVLQLAFDNRFGILTAINALVEMIDKYGKEVLEEIEAEERSETEEVQKIKHDKD